MNKRIYYYDRDLPSIYKKGRAFNFIIGGRGTGKTVGHVLDEIINERMFLYTRRTQDEINLQIDNQVSEGMDLFKKVNKVAKKYYDIELNIYPERFNRHLGLIRDENKIYGYMAALNTIAKIRGAEGEFFKEWIFDEFIPEQHVRKMKNEGSAFLNAYETLNRNREFEGEPPLRVWILANAFSLDHDLFRVMNLTDIIERMELKGIQMVDLPERDILIVKFENKEFIEKKKNTALYRATKGTKFYEMSIENKFSYDDFTGIISRDIRNYKLEFSYDTYGFFRERNGTKYYVCETKMRSKKHFNSTDKDLALFKAYYSRILYVAYANGKLEFQSYAIKNFVLNYLCI